MDDAKLTQSIKMHETFGGKPSLKAYPDSEGVWTAGYGRNLQSMTIMPYVAEEWLVEDIYTAIVAAKKFPEWASLDTDARQNAFVEMIYNMGPHRVAGFVDTLAAIRAKDWEAVARDAYDSRWAHQLGDGPGGKLDRPEILIRMFQTGEFPA